jgi:glycosyltransferase involved in cell wall biosynthesis
VQLHTHDPFRGIRATSPRITADTLPVDRPLNIVAWVDRYPPWRGCLAGGEMALHGILRPLADRGHTVRVATHSHPGGGPVDFDGIPVHPEADIAGLLDGADVIVSHLLWTKHAVQASARGQIPLVYLFHNDFTIEHWRLATYNVTGVVYNTDWIRSSITGKHPLWCDVPAVVVRPPIDLDRYHVDPHVHDLGCDREYVTLVNPNQGKGGPLFYRMAEARPDMRFLAVEGAYGQQIRPRRGRHRNVAWQPQTTDMTGDVYARTRVLVVPSEYESFGRVAAEAAACGCLVIASDTPGLREALGPGGLYAPAGKLDRWLAWLDAMTDREVYLSAQDAQADHVQALADAGVAELDALEDLLRRAAGAERLPSEDMGGHDPFRATSQHRRHARSVEAGQGPERPQERPEEVPAPAPGTEAERLAEAGVADPEAQAVAAELDQAGTEREAPGTGMVMEGVETRADGTWSDEIESDGSGEALPPVDTTTQEGAGADGPDSGEDAGDVPEASAPDVDTGDGPGSHDAGRSEPEPAPATQQAEGTAPATDGAASPDSDVPVLVDQVPKNATGPDGIVAWIDGAANDAERYDRAVAAEHVEKKLRPEQGKKPRKAVIAVTDPILYLD